MSLARAFIIKFPEGATFISNKLRLDGGMSFATPFIHFILLHPWAPSAHSTIFVRLVRQMAIRFFRFLPFIVGFFPCSCVCKLLFVLSVLGSNEISKPSKRSTFYVHSNAISKRVEYLNLNLYIYHRLDVDIPSHSLTQANSDGVRH